MIPRLTRYADFLTKLLLIISIVLTVMLSFYWGFGLETFEIKSIFTPDTGLFSMLIDPVYILALVTIFSFYVGYRLYINRELNLKIRRLEVETEKEMIIKYLLSIALGIVGVWVLYNEFGKPLMFGYYLNEYVQISKASLAQKISAIIALLLLLIWFLVIEIRVGPRHKKKSMNQRSYNQRSI